MSIPSRVIVLEGLDGVGKSTLAKKLAEQLDAQFMSTPGESFKGIRSMIMDAFGEDQLAKALFYAATVSSEGRKARSIVEQGRSVVMDRYWVSTVAYAKARGVSANLDALESDLIPTDITVLITLDENTRLQRLHQRGMTAEDLETINEPFKQAVMRELEMRSDITVDVTTLNPDGAATKVASAINEYLGRMTPVKGAHL
ncbi:MAG TPA: thymidylate kinase [Pseudomonas sabulinigri]|uniref:dTMP kinase n=1 Tax=marine sediment metagenome TaxID=412755 RepID=A0A0F9XFY6_9ZZZZ|nr:thymidylate kinase [Halopseudomonas sabulinigri]HEC51132.1 thymidylate kinase [Halopseudomonas sabulinigri]